MYSRMVSLVSVAFLVCSQMIPLSAAADQPPQLILKINPRQPAGTLRDGELVGRGAISSTDSHSGFQVWAEATNGEMQSTHYLLQGQRNSRNHLRIRLQRDASDRIVSQQEEEQHGLILPTSENYATFEVVADGEQKINADVYSLQVLGAIIVPKT